MHILRQLIDTLHYLHDTKQIVHRDLKPENILVEEVVPAEPEYREVYIKLTDFGFASIGTSDLRGDIGTPLYKAPELFDQGARNYDEKVDVWAFGIIAFFLLSGGNHPFLTQEEREDIDFDEEFCYEKIRTREPDFTTFRGTPELKQIIVACLKRDPSERPTAADICRMDEMGSHGATCSTN